MTELIGVYHVEQNLDHLMKYISNNYKRPKSVMLELSTYWRDFKGFYFSDISYFRKIASEFEKQGVEVIAGDKNRDMIISKEDIENLDRVFWETLANNKIRSAKLSLMSVYVHSRTNIRVSTRRKIRNDGFLETFLEEKPDLTIVGDAHARYLKKHIPELNYTFFRGNSFDEIINYYSFESFLNLLFAPNPDKIIVADLKNPRNKK